MTSSKKIVSGITWTAIQTLVNRTSGFIVKLVLARLLFPEDYGLIGMAVVFTSFFKSFTDLGFSTAIIQRDDQKINQGYLSTAFWSNLFWSLVSFIFLVVLIAPFASNFYQEPILISVIPALGLPILTTPFYFINRAILVRDLQFKKISHINNAANIIAGVIAISMAFAGYGVWALVAHNIIQSMVEMPLYYFFSSWKPTFVWKKKEYKDMIGFTAFTTFSELLSRLASNGDYFIVGKLLGKIELGLYSFAFILTDSIRIQIKMIIDTVMYPVFSKLKEDKKQQEYLLSKTVLYNCLVTAPIMGLLILNPEIITLFFGEKWNDSLLIIQIIAIASMIQILTNSFPTLMRANGFSKTEFNYQLIKVLFLFFPIVFVGTYYYGLIGCSTAIIVSRILQNGINLFGFHAYLSIGHQSLLKNYYWGVIPSFIGIVLLLPFRFLFLEKGFVFLIFSSLIYGLIVLGFTFALNKHEINKILKFKKVG